MNRYAVAIYDIESETNNIYYTSGKDSLDALNSAMLDFLSSEVVRGVIEPSDRDECLSILAGEITAQHFIKKCREMGWILDYPLDVT